MHTGVISTSAILLYVAAILTMMLALKQSHHNSFLKRCAIILSWLALGLHAILLQQLILQNSGLNLGFSYSLTLISWSVTFLLMVSAIYWPILNLGIPLLLTAAASIIIALLYPATAHTHAVLLPIIKLHILLSILAYSILSLGSLQAILLYIQDYRLHHHKQDRFTLSLPSLEKMEKILFFLLSVGFTLLTIALAIGLPYVDSLFTHKIIFSLIAWFVFATLLIGHKIAGWRGRLAIRWTLCGIISLLLAFFGSKLVIELILGR